jgi:DNA-binding CsgD family transcriptional regulator/pimeloyl-ACP methyl ester carboxylesterase
MDAPPVQYVKTSDGYDIAYCVSGAGPPLILTGAGFMHVQLAWQMPRLKDWLQSLAARFQLVQFDIRGTGLSARDVKEGLRADDYQLDLEAVVDGLGLGRVILFGHTFLPTCIAAQYAVRHPDRASAVIMSGTVSALGSQRAPALFSAIPDQDWDMFLRTIVQIGQDPESPAQAQEMVEIFKQSYDQRVFRLMAQAAFRSSLVDLLPQLKVPALVLTTRKLALYPPEEPLKVARLAHAQVVTLDGRGPYGDAGQGIQAIEAFLAALPSSQSQAGATTGGASAAALSERELEVLRLLAAGRSNQQIADELVISLNTVRRHVSNVFDKIGVANRAQATAYAKDHGIA